MMAALADSGLRAEDIGYVNAHATATQGGDPVEAESIRSVFGETTAVSSTKALHGHLLGAASAIELLITVLAVQDGFLPATAHLGNEDIDPLCRLGHVLGNTARANPKHAMSFSAGFGGTNVSLVVSAIDADTIADPLSPSRSQ
jgi:3-oxoacyl-[acyl-carrier-protein] synthase II